MSNGCLYTNYTASRSGPCCCSVVFPIDLHVKNHRDTYNHGLVMFHGVWVYDGDLSRGGGVCRATVSEMCSPYHFEYSPTHNHSSLY